MSFSKTIKKKGTRFNPRGYQDEGIQWLLNNPSSGLFLAPGLGKTAIVLKTFSLEKSKGIVDKMLVIAPLRVCSLVWPYEVKKWEDFSDLSVGVLHGPEKEDVLRSDHDIYAINPEGLKWLSKSGYKFSKKKWRLVFDESSLFKNGRSQRFKLAKKIINDFQRVSILTGTPAPNGMENIWSQIYLLDGGHRLGRYITAYRNKFFYPSGYMGYEYKLQPGADKKIHSLIEDIVLHKDADELDLPEKIENTIAVKMPKKARKIYDEMKNELIAMIDSDLSVASNAAVASGKLRQICNGRLYGEDRKVLDLHEEKILALEELISSMEGRPMMVFYEFQHDLAALKKKFPHAEVLGGGVSRSDSESIVHRWNSDEIQVLLLHPKSAGHGLNLQESSCRDICWFSIPWDLELYEQAIARVHRQGVKDSVTIHHITAEDTIDEKIIKVLKKKGSMQKSLLEALK